jgi:HD-like signal output (HDOD) protein
MENLGLLPEIANKVMEITQSPNVSISQIEAVVARDAGLSSKILKVANSSYYGGKNVNTINRAIMSLGMNSVRQLTFTAAYQQVSMHRPSAPSFDAKRFWGHSLGTAVLARGLARFTASAPQAEELYLSALLHDIGILMLDRLVPELLETLLQTSYAENQPLHQIGTRMMGFNHADLGAEVVRQWGFGDLISEPIQHQYDPAAAPKHQALAHIVSIANGLAHGNGLLNQGPASDVSMESIETLGLTPDQVETVVMELICEVQEAQNTFQLVAV